MDTQQRSGSPTRIGDTSKKIAITMYDIVRLRHPLAHVNLPAGACGTVVLIYDDPSIAYEVEFMDDEGVTLAIETLSEQDLELVES